MSLPEGARRPGRGRKTGRLAVAALIIVLLTAGCCAVDVLFDASRKVGVVRAAFSDDPGSDGAAAVRRGLPEGFEQEVLDLSEAEGLRVAAEGAVVGFSEAGDARERFDSLRSRLEGKGWAYIESGEGAYGSFMKGSGRFTWLFASCTQVGDAVAVVLQCAPAAEE